MELRMTMQMQDVEGIEEMMCVPHGKLTRGCSCADPKVGAISVERYSSTRSVEALPVLQLLLAAGLSIPAKIIADWLFQLLLKAKKRNRSITIIVSGNVELKVDYTDEPPTITIAGARQELSSAPIEKALASAMPEEQAS